MSVGRAWFGRGVRTLSAVLLVALVMYALYQGRLARRGAELSAAYLKSAGRVARQIGGELDNIERRASVLVGSHRAAQLLERDGVLLSLRQGQEGQLEAGIAELRQEKERRLAEGPLRAPAVTQGRDDARALTGAREAWDLAVTQFLALLSGSGSGDAATKELASGSAAGAPRASVLVGAYEEMARRTALLEQAEEAFGQRQDDRAFEERAALLVVLALLGEQPPGLLPSYAQRVGQCDGDLLCQLREIAELGQTRLSPRTCLVDDPEPVGEAQVVGGRVVVHLAEPELCAEDETQGNWWSERALPIGVPGHRARQGEFDQAFLLDRDGRVLLSLSGSESHEIDRFDRWCSPSTESSECKPDPRRGEPLQGAGVRQHDIAGSRYHVFLHRVARKALLAEAPGREQDLYVAVLVGDERLLGESRRIAPTWILWATLILGLALLSLPTAKLWLMGPRTRYRQGDMALLAVSATLLALIILAGSWSAHLQLRLRDWHGQRLERIASQMAGQVRHEMQVSAEALRLVDEGSAIDRSKVARFRSLLKEHQAWGKRAGAAPASSALLPLPIVPLPLAPPAVPAAPKVRPDAWSPPLCQLTVWQWQKSGAVEPLCEGVGVDLDTFLDGPTGAPSKPIFVWFTPKGDQILKYASSEPSTLPVNLSEWPPVSRAIRGRSCPEERLIASHDAGRAYCTDIERSENTGRARLVTTAFVERPRPGHDEDTWVGVLGRTPGNIFRPVLPRGVDVLVVDSEGIIKFETNRAGGAMGLSVMADLGDTSELEARIRARVDGRFVDDYRGIRSLFAVVRIPEKNWYVLSIAPLGDIERMVATISGVSMTGVSICILALVVCCLLAWLSLSLLPRPEGSKRWGQSILFRPQVHKHEHYAVGGVLCVALGVAFLFASVFIPWVRFPLLGILAVGALFVPWLALGFSRRQPWALARRLKHRFPLEASYSIWLFGLVTLWVGAPATVLVAAAYDHVVANAVRADQTDLEEALRERASRTREYRSFARKGSEQAAASAKDGAEVDATEPERPWLMWGQEPAPRTSRAENLDPSVFGTILEFLAGPLGTPRRSDGYLHRAGFHRADWARASIPPERYSERGVATIPWMLGFDIPSVVFLLTYMVVAFASWGLGVLIVRKVFFTDLLTHYRLAPEPFPENLERPIVGGERVALVCTGEAARDALGRDFRFQKVGLEELKGAAAERRTSGSPLFLDLMQPPADLPAWRTLAGGAGRRGLLIVLDDDQDVPAGGTVALRKAGFDFVRIAPSKPLGAPPRFIVHRASATVRAKYAALRTPAGEPRLVPLGPLLVTPQGYDGLELKEGQGILIGDLDALLREPDVESRLEWMLALRVPIVAFGMEAGRYDASSETLAHFREIFGPAACAPRWSRFEQPTLGEMEEALNLEPDELALLRQVADTTFVPPHRSLRPTVEKLLARGLLDPDSLMLHPTFAAHVRATAPPPAPKDEKAAELDRTTWDAIKYPLGTVVASLLAAFGVSEPSWAVSGVLGPSALAALPSLANVVLGMFTREEP